MFNENLKRLRKQRNMSQETLANQLHVTRQTISKWENGLSVPDADLLIRLSEIFDTTVSESLGDSSPIEDLTDTHIIAEKLEYINLSLMEKNRRSQKNWRIIKLCLLSLLVIFVICIFTSILSSSIYNQPHTKLEMIEEIE